MSVWNAFRLLVGAAGAEAGRRTPPRSHVRLRLEELESRNAPGSLLGTTANMGLSLLAPSLSEDLAASVDGKPSETRTTANAALSVLDPLLLAGTKTTTTGGATAAAQRSKSTTGGGGSETAPPLSENLFSDPTPAAAVGAPAQPAASPSQAAGAPAVSGAANSRPTTSPSGVVPQYLLPMAPPMYVPNYSSSGAVRPGAVVHAKGAAAPAIPLTTTAWSLVGPAPVTGSNNVGGNPAVSGRVAGIAADPTNPNIIYMAAAGGGVWKTTDAGVSWKAVTDTQSTLFMGAIAVSASNPNVIYAGTGESTNSGLSFYGRGVLKSSDGGATWTLENNNGAFDRKTISKVVIDPTTPDTVYVAIANGGVNGVGGNDGVWKSTDGGATWTNTTTAIPGVTANSVFSDLVINQTTPTTLYCAIGAPNGAAANGVYMTTDGGTTWTAAGNFTLGAGDGNIKIDISKSNPLILYASVVDPGTQGIGFVSETVDGGTTWTNVTKPPNYMAKQGDYDSTVAVDPTTPTTVFLGGAFNGVDGNNNFIGGVLESTDSGTTWNDITVGADGQGVHPDHHAMAFDAAGKLLEGNDGGIWRLQTATVGSIAWQDINGNLSSLQFIGIGLNLADANTAYGGTQDNGTDKFTGSLPWAQVQGGDGGFVRVDFTNPNTVYHTFFRLAGSTTFIERSDDSGATWNDISAGIGVGDKSDFYVPYQMDQTNSSRLILGTDHLYETTNKGVAWKIIATKGTGGFNIDTTIDAIGLSKSSPNTIYVGDNKGHIFVTTNDGVSWTQRNITGVDDHIQSLVVDPTNSMSVYAVRDRFGVPGKVFHSTDGGATWTDVSGNLPDLPAYSLALDTTNNILYVGNDNGVFASKDGGTTWAAFGTGLPNVEVRDLQLNSTLGILAAGTHGRSTWEIATTATGGGGGGGGGGGNVTVAFNAESEVNQTSDTALNFGALIVGQPTNVSNLSIAPLPDGRNDYDWFSWTAGQAGTFTATEGTTAGGSMELHLFTLQGRTLVELANSTLPGVGTQALSAAVAAGQEILVEVKGQNPSFGVTDVGNYQITGALT